MSDSAGISFHPAGIRSPLETLTAGREPVDKREVVSHVNSQLSFRARGRGRRRLVRLVSTVGAATVAGSSLGLPSGAELLRPTVGPEPASEGVEASDSAAALVRFRRTFGARPAPRRENRSHPAGNKDAGARRPPSLADIVYRAAAEFGVDGGVLLGVARCESDLDPAATSGAGYYGLFQFDRETWAAYGYGSIYDPMAQARTAARLIAAGETSRWPNCL
jgi:Transglycosylase-like domain